MPSLCYEVPCWARLWGLFTGTGLCTEIEPVTFPTSTSNPSANCANGGMASHQSTWAPFNRRASRPPGHLHSTHEHNMCPCHPLGVLHRLGIAGCGLHLHLGITADCREKDVFFLFLTLWIRFAHDNIKAPDQSLSCRDSQRTRPTGAHYSYCSEATRTPRTDTPPLPSSVSSSSLTSAPALRARGLRGSLSPRRIFNQLFLSPCSFVHFLLLLLL